MLVPGSWAELLACVLRPLVKTLGNTWVHWRHLLSLQNCPRKLLVVCMYVCMVIIYSKSVDKPGKVTDPARVQLNRGK